MMDLTGVEQKEIIEKYLQDKRYDLSNQIFLMAELYEEEQSTGAYVKVLSDDQSIDDVAELVERDLEELLGFKPIVSRRYRPQQCEMVVVNADEISPRRSRNFQLIIT